MAITLQELAQLAGVSHTTVSLVLRGKHQGRVSEATRKQILNLVEKHGYRPNVAARGLVQGRTYRIALCIQGYLEHRAIIGQFSFHQSLALLSRRIHAAGYTIELIEVDAGHKPEQVCRDLAGKAVDGFVLIGWEARLAEKLLFSLKEKTIPAVAISAALDDDSLTWCDVDREGAIRNAAALLFQEGHQTVALLDLDPMGHHRDGKIEAFCEAAECGQGTPARNLVFRLKEPELEAAVRITNEAFDQLPSLSALVLTDNFYADGVILALRQRGIEPGKDCRLIGLGDTVLADRARPRLTHYSLMMEQQAAFAFDSLLDEIQNPSVYRPRHKQFESRLIMRET